MVFKVNEAEVLVFRIEAEAGANDPEATLATNNEVPPF
jgi:hypothetical protein